MVKYKELYLALKKEHETLQASKNFVSSVLAPINEEKETQVNNNKDWEGIALKQAKLNDYIKFKANTEHTRLHKIIELQKKQLRLNQTPNKFR